METEKISKLLVKFCVPALASSLVTCMYNIVDQLFIGNLLGVAGNAATNVVFPVMTLITALSLMCGVGPANSMNIKRGNGEIKEAAACVGGGFGLMVICGLICMIPMLLFTETLLSAFGCTDTVMPYAESYARIISLSFVFSMIGASGPFIIRADGSPNFSLAVVAAGAVSNIILDALFIYGLGWGIEGAAWATLIAQSVSTGMVIWYMMRRFSAVKLRPSDFMPDAGLYLLLAGIGAGPAFNFGTQAIVQVFLNNALRIYGAGSVYGSDVCLAVAGVANKVNTLANALIVGMTNGLQPIASFNFGRGNYERVAEAAKKVVTVVLITGLAVFICYQLFPVQITGLFGDGNEDYYEFAERFFRIFFLLIPLYGLQTSVAGFFSAQGKVSKAIAISLVRQVIFFPLMLILLPEIMGLDGVLWAGPVADLAMAVTAGLLFVREIRKLEEKSL
ncbi:MAG: MATE family efflux transporter [Clostridiales bacterium]|nr:MATE family efflux transporter [Clostridiales bacterium]MDD7035440.1 MATE family efflux transporter [Bacillota bacterium]MDY2919984.1 MATE family efflux transporter [Lentihominibacter sp.]